MARGKAARADAPLDSHAVLSGGEVRRDPVALLESQAGLRVADLVPIRYGRMLTSPFAFYRGAALVQAADLAGTPRSGLVAQLCGDAHLANFGLYLAPDRRLVFDINDFDETNPGPFEWDVKRLAGSFAVAGRANGFKAKARRNVLLALVGAYRETLRELASMGNLAVWYSRADVEELLGSLSSELTDDEAARTRSVVDKARTRDSLHAFERLTTFVDGEPRIAADPPLILPVEDVFADESSERLYEELRKLVRAYRGTLQSDRSYLLEQFKLVHVARKVVGVGSVGTRAWILLLLGRDNKDPLFLQAKEAQASVLEDFAGASAFTNSGQRVVAGQHLMQATSDIFLGWQRVRGVDGANRDYYVRQLRDGKGSIAVEKLRPASMALYARLCGRTLARAHARGGDRIAISAYLGKKETFDRAIAEYAEAYADQTESDHSALRLAADTGRISVVEGV